MLQALTIGFPSVYVWMRQLGAWKLHPYNSIVKISVIYNGPNFAQSGHVLKKILKFSNQDSNNSINIISHQ